jgi:hypothetical protein
MLALLPGAMIATLSIMVVIAKTIKFNQTARTPGNRKGLEMKKSQSFCCGFVMENTTITESQALEIIAVDDDRVKIKSSEDNEKWVKIYDLYR